MLTGVMRRLQILMDPDLDDALERLASKERKSKSALIRELVRRQVSPLPPLEQDPIWGLVGFSSFDPVPPEEIDEVVYGDAAPSRRRRKSPARKTAS
jgi:hypothetical protein